MNKTKVQKLMIDVLADIAGCFVFSLGIHSFTAPSQIALGGVSGLAVIINYLSNMSLGTASLLLNIPLLLFGYKFLGRGFTLRTMRTVVILTIMLDYVIPYFPTYQGDAILAALSGGACFGVGLALIFMRGSTTGGADIAMRLVQLPWPHLSVGKVILVMDAAVLVLCAITFQNIATLLYGMIAIFAQIHVLDSILYGLDSGRLLYIFSTKEREIAAEIIKQLDRGVTFLQGEGGYSGTQRPVMLCAVRNHQYFKLKKLVNDIDPEAFMIITEAREILGSGFRRLHEQQQ